jgi:alpha-D-xyloside xylohydrolase
MRFINAKRILNYQQEGNRVLFKVDAVYVPMFLILEFPDECIVNLRITGCRNSEKERTIIGSTDSSMKISIEEEGDLISVRNGYLKVCLNRENVTFAVFDKDGRQRLSSVNDDETVWKQVLNRPLGYHVLEDKNSLVTGIDHTSLSFLMRNGESFFGLGEQFKSYNHRGKRFSLWNKNGAGSRNLVYKNVPFLLSSENYGVYINNTDKIDVDLGATSSRAWGVEIPGTELDLYFFVADNPGEILQSYTDLTGKAPQLPPWSFGLWMTNYFIEASQDSVKEQTSIMREKQIPCDVYHIDTFWIEPPYWNDFTWRKSHFPEPKKMIGELHDDNYKVCLWENPNISNMSDLYEEGVENGYFVTRDNGEVYHVQVWRDDLMTLSGLVDFTNPEAVEWYKEIHRNLFDMGVDVFKTDFGEEVPPDAVWHNGADGRKMHNLYTFLYNKTVSDVTSEEKGYSLVWGRSAWAGSQRFPVQWSGDPHATWEDMAAVLRSGLSFTNSGFSYWSHDIGGFKDDPDDILYVRWSQFGLFSTHARLHGWGSRNPWDYSPEAMDIFRETCILRYRMIPYLMQEASVALEEGLPLMRSLYLAFPEDRTTHYLDSQYMLGRSLLVAPVLNEDHTVEFYLPGRRDWFDFYTGKKYAGSSWYSETVPLDKIPLFVPDNSILYLAEERQFIGDEPDFNFNELRIFPGNDSIENRFGERHWCLDGGKLSSDSILPETIRIAHDDSYHDINKCNVRNLKTADFI